MRRRVFLKALQNVVSNLNDSGILPMLRGAFDGSRGAERKDKGSIFNYQVFLDYALGVTKFGEEEKEIVDIMGLSVLSDPEWWQELAALEPNHVYQILERAQFAARNLPTLAKLLKQDYLEEGEDVDSEPTLSSELRGKKLLSVTLVENHGQFSSPARLVFVLEAINDFYNAMATLEELPHSDLAVLALDSGSDKSFDFLGLAKVMDSVKELILGIWDRRFFNRHLQVGACVENIAQSLPVLERIHKMKEDGALAPEQAELLKRQIISGTTKFLEAGAVIPEMGAQLGMSPRSLMRPEQKMLAAPDAHSAPVPEDDLYHRSAPSAGTSGDSGAERDAEIAHLEEMLRRAKGGN